MANESYHVVPGSTLHCVRGTLRPPTAAFIKLIGGGPCDEGIQAPHASLRHVSALPLLWLLNGGDMNFERFRYELQLMGKRVILTPIVVMVCFALFAELLRYLHVIPARFLSAGLE